MNINMLVYESFLINMRSGWQEKSDYMPYLGHYIKINCGKDIWLNERQNSIVVEPGITVISDFKEIWQNFFVNKTKRFTLRNRYNRFSE